MPKNTVSPSLTTVVELPVADALYLARAGIAAVSKDDITPVITGVRLSAEGGLLKVLATDRFRVHRAVAVLEGDVSFEPVNVPSSAWRWLIANAGFFGRGLLDPLLRIEIVRKEAAKPSPLPAGSLQLPEGSVTVTIYESTDTDGPFVALHTQLVPGGFPEGVEKLLDDAIATDPDASDAGTVDLDFLAKCRPLASYRGEKPKVKFVAGSNPTKPGQVVVTYSQGQALIAKALDR